MEYVSTFVNIVVGGDNVCFDTQNQPFDPSAIKRTNRTCTECSRKFWSYFPDDLVCMRRSCQRQAQAWEGRDDDYDY